LHFEKHTLENLPYNNLTNTRIAKDVLCNTICYVTKKEREDRTTYLFKAH
jgi:hypothetical protein